MRRALAARPATVALLIAALATVMAGCDGSSSAEPVDVGGTVRDPAGAPLAGAMLTFFDPVDDKTVTVFSGDDGRYELRGFDRSAFSLLARRGGFRDATVAVSEQQEDGQVVDVEMTPASAVEVNLQRPARDRSRLLTWPDEAARRDFVQWCAYCHQVGTEGFRSPGTLSAWTFTVEQRMKANYDQLHSETQEGLSRKLFDTFGPGAEASWPAYDAIVPTGASLAAVVTEWPLGPVGETMMHDLELGEDGLVYLVDFLQDALRVLDPATGERRSLTIPGGKVDGAPGPARLGPHSIEKAPNGDMWITLAVAGTMARYRPSASGFTVVPSAEDGQPGAFPHTLRFDAEGLVWYTDSGSNSVYRLDPQTFAVREYPLLRPEATTFPQPYGIDVAPDGRVWFSKLHGERIGVIDPATGGVTEWRPNVQGPRRLRVGPDGVVWIPGFTSGDLGRFDPSDGTWQRVELPGGGHETPYAVAVHPETGDVWICGTSSDTMMRFRPSSGELVVIPLPSRVSYTREIEFSADGSIWTSTSNWPASHGEHGRGAVVRIELPR